MATIVRSLAVALIVVVTFVGPAAADGLVLFGAGSLREAMTQITRDFQAKTGTSVRTEFGQSGVMRERIEKGEHADAFASRSFRTASFAASSAGAPSNTMRPSRRTRSSALGRASMGDMAEAGRCYAPGPRRTP